MIFCGNNLKVLQFMDDIGYRVPNTGMHVNLTWVRPFGQLMAMIAQLKMNKEIIFEDVGGCRYVILGVRNKKWCIEGLCVEETVKFEVIL